MGGNLRSNLVKQAVRESGIHRNFLQCLKVLKFLSVNFFAVNRDGLEFVLFSNYF